jgi:2-phospho-L-lactate guanylyltransferase (CobY/MobA/RfbA family)
VIDTHAHLDACADPPDVTVARARAAGIEVAVVEDAALAVDVDRPSDLVHVEPLLVAEPA